MSENVNAVIDETVEEEVLEVAEATEEVELTEEELEKLKKKIWAERWDKITTGLLIALMASPFLILGYIFLWFLIRTL